MSKKLNSLELIIEQAKDFSDRTRSPQKKDIVNILDTVKIELISDGYSPLLDVAYKILIGACTDVSSEAKAYIPSNFIVSKDIEVKQIPNFDSRWLMNYLPEDFKDGSASEYKATYFKPDYAWVFYSVKPPKSFNIADLNRQLKKIDEAVALRKKSSGKSPEAEAVIPAAPVEAEAERTMPQAVVAESAKAVSAAAADKGSNPSEYAECSKSIQEDFASVRSALLQANESMKKIENAISESMVKKIYSQYIELYNLIADTQDSARALAEGSGNADLGKSAQNMGVFLDMISEYLADFGIQTVATASGDKFSAKLHSAVNCGAQFDPRSAVVKASLRAGFVWDEQVLQKEKISV